MPVQSSSTNPLTPNLGIQDILEAPVAGNEHLPGARQMAVNLTSEPGLEELYPGISGLEQIIDRQLLPSVGEGESLRPERFRTLLWQAAESGLDPTDPAQSELADMLKGMQGDTELMKMYTALMVQG